jgi:tRNA pseudouridine38-40 synthase
MPRYKLTIEYCGTGLVGWQRQAKGLSVQQALETAIHDFCGESVRVFGAGRTDAGVHALAQIAHVDLAREHETDVIRGALNHHLRPHAISVVAVEPVSPDFDARRSATARHYLYRILNAGHRRRSIAAGCGMSRRRSIWRRCRRAPAISSGITISPPSATRCARHCRR